MALRPEIRVNGARDLRRRFREVEDDMADLKALHKELGDMVADTAKKNVPVQSGLLQSTIRSFGTKTMAGVRAGNNRKSASGVPYAGVVHYGTPSGGMVLPSPGLPEQPFLTDALAERKREVIDRYSEGIDEVVRKVF